VPERSGLKQANRLIDTRAKPMADALKAWLARFASSEAARWRGYAKAESADDARARAQLEELIRRFGLRQAEDAAGRAVELVGRDRQVRTIPLAFEELDATASDKARGIIQASRDTIERQIRGVVEEAEGGRISSSQGDMAREIRRRIGDHPDFGFERALTIARTEIAVAENSGTYAGYEAAGVTALQWLAYTSPIWPRRHDRMNEVEVPLGELFTLPSGTRVKHPHDPAAPAGEVVNCKCSTRGKRAKPSTTPAPTTEQAAT